MDKRLTTRNLSLRYRSRRPQQLRVKFSVISRATRLLLDRLMAFIWSEG